MCSRESVACKNVGDRASSYGMPGYIIDGNDLIEVYETVKKAADDARKGNGPSLIEAQTYRWGGHHPNDPGAYKDKEEADYYKKEKDPVANFKKKLLADGIITDRDIDKFEDEIKKRIDNSVKFAEESPEPGLDKFLEEVKQI
jgi:pyruvate dehydrogenase E1 component alpha subunit